MLTTTKIKSIKKAGNYLDYDRLYLRVTKTLTKSWIFRYKFNGKVSNLGLGSLKNVSLKEARLQADEVRAKLAQGLNPKQELCNKRIFEDLAHEYIALRKAEWSNAKHAQQWTNTLAAYAFPFIGKYYIEQIDTKLIKSMLIPIWIDKGETASRVRSRVENVIDYGIALGESDKANPAALKVISKVLPKNSKSMRVKNFESLPYGELPDFWIELSNINAMSAHALKMVILTACRTNEVLNARYSEIQSDVWIIPKERMKSKREHKVPVTDELDRLISKLDITNQWLFPTPHYKDAPLSTNAMLQLLKKVMKVTVTVHGFRATFKTWAEEQTNYDTRLIEASLAHVIKDKTEQAYMRGDLLEKRRLLMNDWCDFITHKLT